MAIRNPAARNSAVIPQHVTTRVVRSGKGFARRAVYSRGTFVGYTVSHLGMHTAWAKNGEQIFTEAGQPGFPYLSDAVVAASLKGNRCKGWATAECGTVIPADADLCGDCGMARMDSQSPRIHA